MDSHAFSCAIRFVRFVRDAEHAWRSDPIHKRLIMLKAAQPPEKQEAAPSFMGVTRMDELLNSFPNWFSWYLTAVELSSLWLDMRTVSRGCCATAPDNPLLQVKR